MGEQSYLFLPSKSKMVINQGQQPYVVLSYAVTAPLLQDRYELVRSPSRDPGMLVISSLVKTDEKYSLSTFALDTESVWSFPISV